MLNDVDGLFKSSQLGPGFGPRVGMVYSICKHDCSFYVALLVELFVLDATVSDLSRPFGTHGVRAKRGSL